VRSLIDHIEHFLGAIEGGWTRSPLGEKLGFQVVKCAGGQVEQAHAFCTVGLSKRPLQSRVSEKLIRHELFILVPETFGDQNIPAVLQQLGSAVLTHESPFLCGEVIERANPIFRDKPFYAFVAAVPVLLPDAFATYTDELGNEIVFVWMVPLTKAEINFVREESWGKLEDIFISHSADLLDVDRSSAV
jgi:Suppressor of fused protein (SUFU)